MLSVLLSTFMIAFPAALTNASCCFEACDAVKKLRCAKKKEAVMKAHDSQERDA